MIIKRSKKKIKLIIEILKRSELRRIYRAENQSLSQSDAADRQGNVSNVSGVDSLSVPYHYLYTI